MIKTFVGVVVALLFVVAVAVFTPNDASAHSAFFFGPVVFEPDTVTLVGCVDDETANALIASGAFITPAPFVLCTEGHTSVMRILPQVPGS